MGKTLFIGPTGENTGPANVNRNIILNWPDELSVLEVNGRVQRVKLLVKEFFLCDAVLSMDCNWSGWLAWKLCKLFKKPLIALIHGYAPYENGVNGLGLSESYCRRYDRWLLSSTNVVVFSEVQAQFMKEVLPEISEKIRVCPMGFDWECPGGSRSSSGLLPVVAVSGGTRPIKRNAIVVDAVRHLSQDGTPCELRVYGRDYCGGRDMLATNFPLGSLRYMGHVPQEDFLKDLEEVDVFVMASMHESFGLSAIDALSRGTSLLISPHCGVCEVMHLEQRDMIFDDDTYCDIAKKIDDLIKDPNSERLAASVDDSSHSWGNVAEKMHAICERAVKDSAKKRNNGQRG